MGDLISRQALKNFFITDGDYETIINIPNRVTTKNVIDITIKAYREMLFKAIENQPVAYDVDKVVEQLKEEGCIVDNEVGNRVIEIVKAGGKE